MTGPLRQRGPDTWELRVYLGVEQDSGRERWATKTVHGSGRHATARLSEFVEDAGYARLRGGSHVALGRSWTLVGGCGANASWAVPTWRRAMSCTRRNATTSPESTSNCSRQWTPGSSEQAKGLLSLRDRAELPAVDPPVDTR
jgi:hypothetical protein